MQYFAQSPHESVLANALAAAEDHGITAEHAAVHLAAGAARYWQQAQRAGSAGAPGESAPTAEEAERLRQLEMVRRAGAISDSKSTRHS
jgi:transposase-like protein